MARKPKENLRENTMPGKSLGKPNGRPENPINWEMFEQLCSLQCTQSEIASFLKIHIDTVRDRSEKYYGDSYSNIYKKYSEVGKISLRRYQFVHAKTNTAMSIWLGKQWLGQKDSEEKNQVPPNDSNMTFLLDMIKENAELKKRLDVLESKTASIVQPSQPPL